MKLEQTPFCTAQGLLDFSKALSEMNQKLLTAFNFQIKDNAKQDKLEFWDTKKSGPAFCYGRHLLFGDLYSFWVGLEICTEKVKVTIQFSNTSGTTKGCAANFVYGTIDKNDEKMSAQMKDEYFERFCESLSSQIIANFAAEVLQSWIQPEM